MKVGDYVRTNYGIAKYIKTTNYYVVDKNIMTCNLEGWENCVCSDEIIKSSSNIIDLIEVGDYVNGYKVTMLEDEYYDDVTDSVKKIKDKEKIKIILGNEEQFYGVYAKDIKSILTKEQFESMEYRIGE